jgi:hypothetical protein
LVGRCRGEAKETGIDGSAPEIQDGTAMPLASPVGGVDLCQGESGSGASLGVPARVSDRMCCSFDGVASSEQGARSDDDCCVLSESDPSCAGSWLGLLVLGGWWSIDRWPVSSDG